MLVLISEVISNSQDFRKLRFQMIDDNYSRQVETTTMNVFGFSCKTAGCQAWLKVGELPEDSARSIHFPINLGEDPRRRQCPDCGQARDYYFAEKEIRRLVQEPREEASLISSRRLRS